MANPKSVLLMSMALDLGGAETHVVSLARALKKLGQPVIVASHGGRLVAQLEGAGIPHFLVPMHSRSLRDMLRSLLAIRRIVASENVGLMHAHARIPAWIGSWVSRQTGIPLVTTYHGLYNAHWLFRLVTTPGQQTIAVSDDVKEHLINKLGVPAEQISIVHNGIDLEQFTPGRSPRNPLNVTYISRLSGERGGVALAVLEAADRLAERYPQLTVTIVGDGDRLTEVRRQAAAINEARGRELCRVLGGRNDVPELLAEAGLVIGVGRVAMEAMASCRPVIIAAEYGMAGLLEESVLPEVTRHNFSGRGSSIPTTGETLAGEISRVLDAPALGQAAAQAAYRLVVEQFSMEEKARQILQVYDSCREEKGLDR